MLRAIFFNCALRRWLKAAIVSWLLFHRASATVVSVAGVAEPTLSANYVYYGPQDALVHGESMYISGDGVCNPNDVGNVSGMVVFSDMTDALCSLGVAYDMLNAYGASAFIVVKQSDPPGMHNGYYHHTWDPHVNENSKMTMVTVPGFLHGRLEGPPLAWKNSPNTILLISPPHDRTWDNIYSSWWWVIFARIVPTMLALMTVKMAASEMYLYDRNNYGSVGFIVCFMEVIAQTLLAIYRGSGAPGRELLPGFMDAVLGDLLGTWMLFTTVLVALVLNESDRMIAEPGTERKSVLRTHRCLLMVCVITLPVAQFLAHSFYLFKFELVRGTGSVVWQSIGTVTTLVFCIMFVVCTLVVSFYLIKKMHKLRGPISMFISSVVLGERLQLASNTHSTDPRISNQNELRERQWRTGRLAFLLGISGFLSLFDLGLRVYFALIVYPTSLLSRAPGVEVAYFSLIFPYPRVLISILQVSSIKLSPSKSSGLLWNSWKDFRHRSTPKMPPHGAFELSTLSLEQMHLTLEENSTAGGGFVPQHQGGFHAPIAPLYA